MPRSQFTAEEWRAHEQPTRDNQIWHARRVWYDEGPEELKRHAAIGRECKCGTCFCCAAEFVYQQAIREGWQR